MENEPKPQVKQLEIFDNVENNEVEKKAEEDKKEQKPFMTADEIKQIKEDDEGLEYWQK